MANFLGLLCSAFQLMSHGSTEIQLLAYTITRRCSLCHWCTHSVALLKERFGQQYKLVDAHMEALLNVSTPSNTLAGLQSFHDTIQSHMRALSSLGKPPESYGSLLTSVILSLPTKIKTRMARVHYNSEWTLDELLVF